MSIINTIVPKRFIKGSQYERHAALILERYGFTWTKSKGSPGDKGVDLRGNFILPDSRSFNVIGQCKCTSRSILGPVFIRELIGAQSIMNSNKTNSTLISIFISNKKLSKSAIDLLFGAPLPMAFACISQNLISDQGTNSIWQGELMSFFLNLKLQTIIPELNIRHLNAVNGSSPKFFYEGEFPHFY